MRLRVTNACWHAHHQMTFVIAQEQGFYAREGLEVEIAPSGTLYADGWKSSRQGGPEYDEIDIVLQDMKKQRIDIATDVCAPTAFLDHLQGQDEMRIIGAWRNRWTGAFVAAPGIKSIKDLKGKRIGTWMRGKRTMEYWWWYLREFRKAGLDIDKDVEWVVGYEYGSMREAAKPLREGKIDGTVVQIQHGWELKEEGYNMLANFLEVYPKGRPMRVITIRKSFLERNRELLKRYLKASIRTYHFMRTVPENYPFLRYAEAKGRQVNPDIYECLRPLFPMPFYESLYVALDGKIDEDAMWEVVKDCQQAGILPESFSRSQMKAVMATDLADEAWHELSQTDEIKASLERLQPLIEKWGY